MQGWKEKLLSKAGKEVMIKAVVQSIPTYSMSVFKLPIGLCKDIKAMIRKFWWGKGSKKKSIGLSGALFVRRNWCVEWVLETFKTSIMLFLENRFGAYCITKILYYIRSLVQNIFQMVALWRLQFI